MIWLFGDSIFGGHGVGHPNEIGPDHPLQPLQSPASMMNLLLGGQDLARFGGPTGLPDGVDKGCAVIAKRIAQGLLQPGASVVMLDVGPHGEDPDAHERNWLRLRDATTRELAADLTICEGFDGGASGRIGSMHDRPFGDRTPNQAVRAAAEAPGIYDGRTRFLPTSRAIDEFSREIQRRHGVSAYHPDGVHLNIWGQLKLCALILGQVRPLQPLNPYPVLKILRSSPSPASAATEELVALALAGAIVMGLPVQVG